MENNKRLRLFSRMYFIQWLFLTALFSLVTMNGYAQGKAVTGKIIDSTGEPVIGASVLVKGTSNGVISDIDGNFSLQGVANDAILQISFVGYKSQEISVAGKSKIDVTLVEDTEMLDEVVVVGYGVQKKSDVTGALAFPMGLGRTVFYRKVRGVTGYSPNEYIRIVRMKKAAELLLESNYTVSEVSYKVGINDPFYFSKCFKHHFGVSPSAYREGTAAKPGETPAGGGDEA